MGHSTTVTVRVSVPLSSLSSTPLAQPLNSTSRIGRTSIDLSMRISYLTCLILDLFDDFLPALLPQEAREGLQQELDQPRQPAGHQRDTVSSSGMRATIFSDTADGPPSHLISQPGALSRT